MQPFSGKKMQQENYYLWNFSGLTNINQYMKTSLKKYMKLHLTSKMLRLWTYFNLCRYFVISKEKSWIHFEIMGDYTGGILSQFVCEVGRRDLTGKPRLVIFLENWKQIREMCRKLSVLPVSLVHYSLIWGLVSCQEPEGF